MPPIRCTVSAGPRLKWAISEPDSVATFEGKHPRPTPKQLRLLKRLGTEHNKSYATPATP